MALRSEQLGRWQEPISETAGMDEHDRVADSGIAVLDHDTVSDGHRSRLITILHRSALPLERLDEPAPPDRHDQAPASEPTLNGAASATW